MSFSFGSAIRAYRNKRYFEGMRRDLSVILESGSISMLDVGAAGGILPRWEGFKKLISFIGVEPDRRSYEELLHSEEKREFFSYNIIPKGAWSTATNIKINFTRKPMCSTYFVPNKAYLNLFPGAERFDVLNTFDIDCSPIDNLLDIKSQPVDFVKLDLEGGEIEIISGGEKVLEQCLGMHVEIGFQYMRIGQPLFGDVCRKLSSMGFEFIDFITICRWERDKYTDLGQAVFGDALFLRSPEYVIEQIRKTDGMVYAKVKSYLGILLVYERYDLALAFLEQLRSTKFHVEDFYKNVKEIIIHRRRKQIRTVGFIRRMNSIATLLGSPNSTSHYIY